MVTRVFLPFTYQWYKNKNAIPGAISNVYIITNADASSVGDYSVKVVDNRGVSSDTFSQDNMCRLIMNGATLNIEAEDFNYGGGQTLPIASAAPYTGIFQRLKKYAGHRLHEQRGRRGGQRIRLQPVSAVRSWSSGDAGTLHSPRLNFRGELGNVTTNYTIGWNAPSYWQNYTRTLPSGSYNIFAAAARSGFDGMDDYGGNPSVNMVLSKVANSKIPDGSTPTTEGGAQGLTTLGTFLSPGTGAWGLNDLIPLTDDTGKIADVLLGGTVTLR